MTTDLERRIARIEARESIRELVFDYSTAVDDRDYERIGEISATTPRSPTPTAATAPRAATPSWTSTGTAPDSWADLPLSPQPPHRLHRRRPRHGNGARHAELALEGTTYQVGLRYADTYRRQNGAWRFGSRTVCFLYFMPLSELVEGGLGAPDRKRYPDVGPVAADLPETLATWRAAKGLD